MPSRRPRHQRKACLVLALLAPGIANAALMHRPISNHPIDMYATPRIHIKYLNDYPITRAEADTWRDIVKLEEPGIKGTGSQSVVSYHAETGREEVDVTMLGDVFIGAEAKDSWDHDSQSFTWRLRPLDQTTTPNRNEAFPRLLQLKLPSRMDAAGGIEDWLCMLPSIASLEPKVVVNDSASVKRALAPVDPEEAMRSLQHLNGKCLYHRAGWFTYAYCHGSHIRQFREVLNQQTVAGAPKEDELHEAYDLGVSPATIEDRLNYWSDGSSELQNDPELELQLAGYAFALAESSHEPELEIVQNTQGRYLVQRWTGGTICDMTGMPRRIEIQFHCRMGGIDEISSIKEIATCQYLMTINSPHLCSLPGFHIPTIDDEPARPVKCRQIIPDDEYRQTMVKHKTYDDAEANALHRGDKFPRGYPAQPHGPAWQFHHMRKGGRIKYPSIEADETAQTVVVKGTKARRSAKAIEADRMDEESRKAWLAEQRAKKIAMRENVERVVEKSLQFREQARLKLWNDRWDVKMVRKVGWLFGVDEQEYRDWWEGMMDELEEEDPRESEKRRMKV